MGRPSIVEQNYYEFKVALQKAVDAGTRIDVSDKQRWANYVRENGIKEVSFKSFAQGKYEFLKPVIIDDDGPWGGYYLHSPDEEAVLKWVRDPD